VILEVLDGGLLTTVQDAGRPDWTHVGVPGSGAADPWSLAVANLLAGNDPGAAALEMTLVGPRLVARDGGLIGLAGADLGGRIVGGRRLRVGRSHRLAAGDEIVFDPGGRADGDSATSAGPALAGARAYLAVPGGVDVPLVLGSRSTCIAGGFGGVDGRGLRTGDRISSVDAGTGSAGPELVWPVEDREPGPVGAAVVLRVLPGPAPGVEAIVAAGWRVAAAADRVGLRLDGPPLPDDLGGEALTHGLPSGAIQVPPDGQPIILSVDHQTTGGYRVPAVVISADLPLVGQLRPGDDVRLVPTDLATADAALAARRDALLTGARALRDAAEWDRLAASAGG
jgi:biotin-dependent carboxylase-like uncharacterized protein